MHIKKALGETKYLSFFIKDDGLSEKYNEIWEKLKILSKKNLIVKRYIMKKI